MSNQTLLVNYYAALVTQLGPTSRHVSLTSSLLDPTSSTKMPTSSTSKAFFTSLVLLVSTKMSTSSTSKVYFSQDSEIKVRILRLKSEFWAKSQSSEIKVRILRLKSEFLE